jgi:sulfate/thiosulfate transport system ATP-binding protein
MSLEISQLTKSFGRFPALGGVSLAAETGEFLALLGPSGSGKTTLLRIIAGLELADGGSVSFKGQDFINTPVGERRIGFVFQHYALFRHMTAAQNIAFGPQSQPGNRRPDNKAVAARVEELLSLVQLEGLGHRYPAQLSGGQRQRVALARALAIEPQILLLDEPFGALDAKVRRELRRWLRALHEKMGLTTIFVTHDQEEALEIADRVAVLRDGQLEQLGTPEELWHEPASAFVYDFLGDTLTFDCVVHGPMAEIAGQLVPIDGVQPTQGRATAYARPDAFSVLPPDRPGLGARIRGVLLAGPEARLDCVLDSGEALEVRIPHDLAIRLAPREKVTLLPTRVRVW